MYSNAPENDMEVDCESKEKPQLVHVPHLSAKELQMEEMELLQVALGQPLPTPPTQESTMMKTLPQNIIHHAKAMNLGPYLFSPFKSDEAYPVLKHGSFILQQVTPENEQETALEAVPSIPRPCEFYLLTNGILLLVHDKDPNAMEEEKIMLQCFSLYGIRSKNQLSLPQCTPMEVQANDPFAFKLHSVVLLLHPHNNVICGIPVHITLTVQVEMGFMEGHQCMMKIKECMESTCQKLCEEKEIESLLWG